MSTETRIDEPMEIGDGDAPLPQEIYVPDPPGFEIIKPVLEVLVKQPHLPIADILNLRFVSKEFNDFIRSSERYCSLNFILTSDPQSFQSLKTFKKGSITSISFSDMNTEEFLSDSFVFDFFVGIALQLKSLEFNKCYVRMGRFIELVSLCRDLRQLAVVDCPALWESSFEILNWQLYMNHFCHRMHHLKKLHLDETKSGVLDWDTVAESFLAMTNDLQSLTLKTSVAKSSFFPATAVIHGIKKNLNKLQELEISRGREKYKNVKDNKKTVQTLWERLDEEEVSPWDLRKLKIGRVNVEKLPVFAKRVPNLKLLELTTVGNVDLAKILKGLKRLEVLILDYCSVNYAELPDVMPQLRKLRKFALTSCNVNDDSIIPVLGSLKELEHLHNLDFSNTYVTERTFEVICDLRWVYYLNLGRTNVNEEAMERILTEKDQMFIDFHYSNRDRVDAENAAAEERDGNGAGDDDKKTQENANEMLPDEEELTSLGYGDILENPMDAAAGGDEDDDAVLAIAMNESLNDG